MYLQEGEIGGGVPVTSGTYVTAKPRVDLLFNDSSIANLKLSAGYTARKYLDSSLSNLDRFSDFDAKTGIELYPKSQFGITLKDSVSMRGFETEAVYADSAYLRRLENRLLAMANVRPGPALSLSGGASLDFEDYRNDRGTSALDVPNLNKRLAWGPRIDLDWNFLPRTAVLLDYTYSQFFWQDNFVYSVGGGLIDSDGGTRCGPFGLRDRQIQGSISSANQWGRCLDHPPRSSQYRHDIGMGPSGGRRGLPSRTGERSATFRGVSRTAHG